jgi:hypothetical protein
MSPSVVAPKAGGGMTENAKMKLREKLGEKSIWTKIKIFYITLFFFKHNHFSGELCRLEKLATGISHPASHKSI